MQVIWKTLKMALEAGETLAEKDISMEPGVRVVSAAVTGQDKGQIVDLGLFENGQKISDPMDLEFWKRSNAGQYLDGFKPIGYKGGSTLTARLSTLTALAAKLDVEIVFGIIQENTSC